MSSRVPPRVILLTEPYGHPFFLPQLASLSLSLRICELFVRKPHTARLPVCYKEI